MRPTYAVRALLCIAVLVGFSTSSRAQTTPRAEFSAGWRLLHVPNGFQSGTNSETLARGWYADVAGNLNRVFAVVGDVSGSYKSFEQTFNQAGINVNVKAKLNVHTFLGGIRANARQQGFTPYVQALFGIARGSAEVNGQTTVAGRTTSISQSESSSDFAFDGGGGVNIDVSNNLAVRVGASYLRVGGNDGGNAFRFGVGVVFPF